MPNWTYNNVIIKGNKTDIKKVKSFLKSKRSVFDFEKVIPRPKELEITEGSITILATQAAGAKRGSAERKEAVSKMSFPQTVDIGVGDNKTQLVIKNGTDLVALGKRYLDNVEKYGYPTWYDWSINNWGTKWNASCAELIEDAEDNLEYTFNTAWASPQPIFVALTNKFPKIEVTVSSLDEGDPYEEFVDVYKDGELVATWANEVEFDEFDECEEG